MLQAIRARSCRVCLGKTSSPCAPLQGPGSCCSGKLLTRQFLSLLWGAQPRSLTAPHPEATRGDLAWQGITLLGVL